MDFKALVTAQLEAKNVETELKDLCKDRDINLKVKIDDNEIKNLARKISKDKSFQITAHLKDTSLKNIQHQLESMIKGMNIDLSNAFNINGNNNPAKRYGQQVGNIVSQSAEKAISNVSSKVIGNGFKVSKGMSDKVESEIESIVKDMTNGKGKVSKITINTKTSFNKKTLENVEELKSATVQYTNATGEAITKTLQWERIGTDKSAKKGQKAIMGWRESTAKYTKSVEEASKVTTNFENTQKKTANRLSNQTKQIYQSAIDKNASKPIKDQFHLDDLERRYKEINSEIGKLSGLTGSAFIDQENHINDLITDLKIYKKSYQDAESTATALRSKPIDIVRDETLQKVKSLEADIKKAGVSSNELTNYLKEMNTALLNKNIDASEINDVLNTYAKARAEVGKLKKELSADQTLEKVQIKADGIISEINDATLNNSGLNEFKATINGVEITVSSLIEELNNVKTAGDISVVSEKWKSFSNAAKEVGVVASNISTKIDKINDAIETKTYDAKIKSLDAKLKNYDSSTDEYNNVENSLKEVKKAYDNLRTAQQAYNTDASKSNTNKLIEANDKLTLSIKKAENEMSILSSTQDKALSTSSIASARKSFISYFENNTKAAKAYKEEIIELQNQLDNMSTVADKANFDTAFKNLQSKAMLEGNTGKSWFDESKRAFSQIVQFTGMYGITQNLFEEIPRQMLTYVADVDDAMTDLQMATGIADTEAKELMKTYSAMGKELKTLGTDVATSSTEWLKQGKSIQEANKLTKDSIILSKIGDMSSEDATKTITAAMKSYNLAENEVMGFIDQISAIDMASATDVAGLSNAFNEVAASAELAGVETEKLLSYAAVIGETSQEGMASVGTSLNAIFARMGNIKLSRLKDYENGGEDLSNVETVLKKNGIALRDTTGQFREFDEVLDETAKKWKNFDSVTQRAVANAFSGTHHANAFVILMEQYEQAQEYMNVATSSSGESLKKFEEYSESLSGSIEDFKNAAQSLSNTTIDSGFLTGIVNVGTTFLEILEKIIDNFGIIQTLIGGFAIGKGITSFVKGFDKPVLAS